MTENTQRVVNIHNLEDLSKLREAFGCESWKGHQVHSEDE
jgi:hypothetical protein